MRTPFKTYLLMGSRHIALTVALCGLASGCAARDPVSTDVILLVPGVGGNTGYGGLIRGLADGGVTTPLVTVGWGAPLPFFFLNFSDTSIHRNAETMLAARIADWSRNHAGAKVSLIGHSAGCGVVLGALRQLPAEVRVQSVLLLAPSVSPGYELAASASHVDGMMQVFYSNRDTFFLSWRTGHFGTYDGVKTRAAGNAGFVPSVMEPVRAKVVQHAYDPTWETLGNDGGHLGCLAQPFAKSVLAAFLIPAAQRN